LQVAFDCVLNVVKSREAVTGLSVFQKVLHVVAQ
jgi:hypothetical protein